MSLPSQSQYDDLNGSEVADILAARFWQFLQTIPEFQRRFALTRVKMRLEISLDVWGATPPKKILHDSLELTAVNAVPSIFSGVEGHHETIQEVDAFTNPPDLVREEHGLPVHRGKRNDVGYIETVPVLLDGTKPKVPPAPRPEQLPPPPTPANLASPTMTKIGKRTYAGWVEQDKGAAVTGERVEALAVGGDKLAQLAGSRSGSDVIPVQPDFAARDGGKHQAVNDDIIRDRFQQHERKVVEGERALKYVEFPPAPGDSDGKGGPE